jgi:hypothetical protein
MISSALIKNTLNYQKENIDTGYKTIVILQGQAEKLAADMWPKLFASQESIKAFESTVSEYKKSRDNLKKMMDDHFNKFKTLMLS